MINQTSSSDPTATLSAPPSSESAVPLPTWKRALDLLLCACVLPGLALMTAMMAVVMRLSSPGPVFFTQDRVGLNGRRFKIFKFRSMHVCAETDSHRKHLKELIHSRAPMQKLDAANDARLIPGAKFLRASGLDELPQIINVLRGDMSFVGPRPCIPYEYEEYSAHQRRRFEAVPGLTGLWQVSGKNRTTFDQMIGYDLRYAREKSLALDLRIIVQTPFALLQQLGDTLATGKARRKVKRTAKSAARERLQSI